MELRALALLAFALALVSLSEGKWDAAGTPLPAGKPPAEQEGEGMRGVLELRASDSARSAGRRLGCKMCALISTKEREKNKKVARNENQAAGPVPRLSPFPRSGQG